MTETGIWIRCLCCSLLSMQQLYVAVWEYQDGSLWWGAAALFNYACLLGYVLYFALGFDRKVERGVEAEIESDE